MEYSEDNLKKFLNRFDDIDMDKVNSVEELAMSMRRWIRWNKSYEDLEVYQPENFRTIVVIHNMFNDLTIYDSWSFLEDVKYLLEEYVMNGDFEKLREVYFHDVYDYWNNVLDGLVE